jgi:hypothetical protein
MEPLRSSDATPLAALLGVKPMEALDGRPIPEVLAGPSP